MTNKEPETQEQIQQRNRAIAKSMSRAGIGEMYHSVKLKDFGRPGEDVIALMDAPTFKTDISTAKGFSIELTDVKHAAFPYALARAMRLMQIDCRVVGLIPLMEYIKEPKAVDESADFRLLKFREFEDAEAIVIPRFFETMDDRPLSRKEFYRLESYLTERMDEGFSVSVQYSGVFKNQDWYSDYFINRLVTANTKVVV